MKKVIVGHATISGMKHTRVYQCATVTTTGGLDVWYSVEPVGCMSVQTNGIRVSPSANALTAIVTLVEAQDADIADLFERSGVSVAEYRTTGSNLIPGIISAIASVKEAGGDTLISETPLVEALRESMRG